MFIILQCPSPDAGLGTSGVRWSQDYFYIHEEWHRYSPLYPPSLWAALDAPWPLLRFGLQSVECWFGMNSCCVPCWEAWGDHLQWPLQTVCVKSLVHDYVVVSCAHPTARWALWSLPRSQFLSRPNTKQLWLRKYSARTPAFISKQRADWGSAHASEVRQDHSEGWFFQQAPASIVSFSTYCPWSTSLQLATPTEKSGYSAELKHTPPSAAAAPHIFQQSGGLLDSEAWTCRLDRRGIHKNENKSVQR